MSRSTRSGGSTEQPSRLFEFRMDRRRDRDELLVGAGNSIGDERDQQDPERPEQQQRRPRVCQEESDPSTMLGIAIGALARKFNSFQPENGARRATRYPTTIASAVPIVAAPSARTMRVPQRDRRCIKLEEHEVDVRQGEVVEGRQRRRDLHEGGVE